MVAIHLDVMNVITDQTLAATLSVAEWGRLVTTEEWRIYFEEHADVLAQLTSQYANLAAVMGYAQAQAPADNPGARQTVFKYLGQRQPRVHGLGVVSNIGVYTQNLNRSNQAFLKTLRSPHPHARLRKIDSTDAEKLPGVVKVIHRENLPRDYQRIKLGGGPPDRMLFPEELFQVGAPVALVLADTEDIADEAMRLVKVEYEILPAVMSMEEGMKSGTPKQWDNKLDGTIINRANPFKRGDPDAAFSTAEVKIEHNAIKPIEQHVALEPTNSLTWWENDRLNMVYTTQGAHGSRNGLAAALRIPQNQVRVVQQGYVGSGYGYRGGIDLPEIHAAVASKISGRPVKMMYTREEDFTIRTHRPTFRNEMKIGVQRDGTITSMHARVIADVGAQRGSSATGAWYCFQLAYNIPNLQLEGIDVMTNRYLSGAYRCVSHPNGTWALETAMEKAAYAVNMDPVEFRLKNLNVTGHPDTKLPWSNPAAKDVIEAAANGIGWKSKFHAPRTKEVRPGVYHGIGLAYHLCSHGAGGEPATGHVMFQADGTVTIISASNEIGPGQRTQMKLIVAEALGMPWDQISITPYIDTDLTTDTGSSGGSRQTNSGGWGVYDAAIDAKQQLFRFAAQKVQADARRANRTVEVAPEDLVVDGKFIKSSKDPAIQLSIKSVVTSAGTTVVGRGIHRNDGRWERTCFAAHAAEVEVDTVGGTVAVTKYVAAHDVGRAISLLGCEQQIEGGVIMSLGSTLLEELLTDNSTGLPLNPNMLDYRVPSIKDVPDKIDVIVVEKPKEYGVFGAHGLGEPPMGPPGPTIANAVHNAIGVWIDELPITRPRLLGAVKSGQ
jgi:CO/xanthine dehydrogenase Mo-binding subunit